MPKISKNDAIAKLNRCLAEIRYIQHVDSETFVQWRRDTLVAIGYIFGQDSRHINDFEKISYLPGTYVMGMFEEAARESLEKGLRNARGVIQSMVREVAEFWDNETSSNDQNEPAQGQSKKVFDRVKYFWDMTTYFSANDVEQICFELGIEFESLPGREKETKTRELIMYCERNNKISELREICQKKRPHVNW